MALGIEMLSVAGVETDPDRARTMLEATRTSGKALEVFARVVEAQGGDPRVTEDPGLVLPKSPHRSDVTATEAGFVRGLDAFRVGVAAMRLGAGRERKEDTIDPAVGITVLVKPGTEVEAGQPILRLSYRHPARLEEALSVLDGAIDIGDEKPEPKPLILERVE
jgi:thymidine phosphorylase